MKDGEQWFKKYSPQEYQISSRSFFIFNLILRGKTEVAIRKLEKYLQTTSIQKFVDQECKIPSWSYTYYAYPSYGLLENLFEAYLKKYINKDILYQWWLLVKKHGYDFSKKKTYLCQVYYNVYKKWGHREICRFICDFTDKENDYERRLDKLVHHNLRRIEEKYCINLGIGKVKLHYLFGGYLSLTIDEFILIKNGNQIKRIVDIITDDGDVEELCCIIRKDEISTNDCLSFQKYTLSVDNQIGYNPIKTNSYQIHLSGRITDIDFFLI